MTTVPVSGPAGTSAQARPVDLFAAEWIKLRSLSSTHAVLLAGFLTACGIAVLACNATANLTAGQHGQVVGLDPLADSFIGFSVAQLLFAAIGVLTMTGEYASGLIRSTFAAVPARGAVLAAKAAVIAAVIFPAGLVSALASFTAGQAMLARSQLGLSLAHPGALRAVLATALFLVAAALIGLAAGVLVRNAAGALTAVVLLLFLAPAFLRGTSWWAVDIANALPANAIRRLTSLQLWPHAPSVTEALIVIAAWPAVALAIAAVVLHRRDA